MFIFKKIPTERERVAVPEYYEPDVLIKAPDDDCSLEQVISVFAAFLVACSYSERGVMERLGL